MISTIDRDDVQGNILNGYPYGQVRYLLLQFSTTEGIRGFLREVGEAVTPATERQPRGHPDTLLNLAVTYAGFTRLGLRPDFLSRFPEAFREPIRCRARSVLGDVGLSDPTRWEEGVGDGSVHLMATIYGRTDRVRDAEAERVLALAQACRGRLVLDQPAAGLPGKREHFGFADGSAQPDIEGVRRLSRTGTAAGTGGGRPLPGGRWQPLKPGEFILGYPDEDGDTDTTPSADLVANGSYLVYRKLRQDVALFRRELRRQAADLQVHEELLAAKMVGRWRDGMPLELDPTRDAENDLSWVMIKNPPNDFRYLPTDRDGHRCPVGAHIRRANPRDSLDFDGKLAPQIGQLSVRHRIIRRGVPYGPELPPGSEQDDSQDRGLIFICFNADFERQFELVQGRWCNDVDALGRNEERDFLLGVSASHAAPSGVDGALGAGGDAPARVAGKVTVPRAGSYPYFVMVPNDIVITRGTEYFFAPGIRALGGLAEGRFS